MSLIIYLLFSASLGKLIVNLQRDARNEFNGSTARRTPHAYKVSLRKSAIPLRIAKLQIESHKTIYIRSQKKKSCATEQKFLVIALMSNHL